MALKVVITGMAGFIGFHTAINLEESGEYEVYGFDNFNMYYDPKLKRDRAKYLKEKYEIKCKNLDLYDLHGLDKYIKKIKPHLVIHLAAMAGVRYSMDNAQEYVDNNVTGTLNLIQVLEKHDIENVIYASTSCVMHGNPLPWKESDKLGPQLSPYGYTKQLNEHMFHISKINAAVGLRFFTVYGPWGRPDMALFGFTDKILNDKPIEVFNHGDMKRDFTYIDDIVDGINIITDNVCESILAHKPIREIYNIGNGRQVQLLDFIEIIEKELGKTSAKTMRPKHDADAKETWSDTTKIRQLGYNPKTPIEIGVKEFVQWYRNYYGSNQW